jgi:hypothetical protein
VLVGGNVEDGVNPGHAVRLGPDRRPAAAADRTRR